MLASLVVLMTGNDGRWHPGIGDPTVMGWVTVAAYLVAAVLAFRAARVSGESAAYLLAAQADEGRKLRLLALFWTGIALAMVALGINKQLDLQTLFTEIARDLSRVQGWYEQRRRYQFAFILLLACAGAGGTFALGYLLRSVLRQVLGAVIGIGWIALFVVVRAASFHYIDILLGMGPGPLRLNWIFELGGIGCVAFSAAHFLRSHSHYRIPVRQATES